MVGLANTNLAEMIAFSKVLSDLGVAGGLVPAPYYFPNTFPMVLEFLRELERASPLPLIFYDNPLYTKTWFRVEELITLVETCPQFKGVKLTDHDLSKIPILQKSGIPVFSGDDAVAFRSLLLGVAGSMIIAPSIFPATYQEVVRMVAAKDDAGALRLFSQRILPFIHLFGPGDEVPVTKAVFKELGYFSLGRAQTSPSSLFQTTAERSNDRLRTRRQLKSPGHLVNSFRRQSRTKPAVHNERSAGHERGGVTGEKHGSLGNLLGPADAPKGMERSCFHAGTGWVRLRLEVACCQTGINVPGANGMYPDTFASMVDRHGFRQTEYGGLGGAVACTPRLDKECIHRRQINDHSSRLPQSREERAGTEKHPTDIDGHLPIPLIGSSVLDSLIHLDGCVVHQNVHRAKLGYYKFGQRFYRRRIRNIRVESHGVSALLPDLRGRSLDSHGVDVRQREASAFESKALRNRFADSRSGSGYNCDPIS